MLFRHIANLRSGARRAFGPSAAYLLIVSLAVLAACGNDAAAPTPNLGADTSFEFDIGLSSDLGSDDTGTPPLDATAPDVPNGDVETPPDVPSDVPAVPDSGHDSSTCDQPGCVCTDNGQCESGYCIENAGGASCAQKCTGECPDAFTCKTVSGNGSDAVSICLPKFPRLCEPCGTDADCQGALGGSSALCVPYGDPAANNPGSFCGAACDDKDPCPLGYSCAEIKTGGGATVKQCKKVDLKCECDARAIKLGLATSCGGSNAYGTCAGKRACSEKTLGACSAATPAAETCDGVDNNCDGKTDDLACDDKNPCTTDSCDPIAKACTHTPTPSPCDDGSKCTSSDTCVLGVCTGKAKDCDDGNQCTDDTCDPSGGCKYDYATGPCSDDACKIGGKCQDGQCLGAKSKNCDDSNSCTQDTCDGQTDPKVGKCLHKALTGGCDDGNACTSADNCTTGTCAGAVKNCDDGNPCTEDTCDVTAGSGGCKSSAAAGKCDDGNGCTLNDYCQNSVCTGQPGGCDDSNPCTTDSCDGAKGCVHNINANSCDDANPCTTSDSCSAGKCTGGVAPKCDDGNACTDDGCDAKIGCTHANNTVSCDDGSACTGSDKCSAGKCTGGANVCGCNTQSDCDAQPNPNLCLGKLVCDTSKFPYACVADIKTKVTCDTTGDNECKKTACNSQTGKCAALLTADNTLCSDGNACTTGDICTGGVCKPTGSPDCDDKNQCTSDSCDPGKGCLHPTSTGACDDGDPCTKNDTCQLGVCKGGGGAGCCTADIDCDDKNACTKDSCNATTGACSHNAAGTDGLACDADGSGCTADVCAAGKCAIGAAPSCQDDACNTSACSSTGANSFKCAKTPKNNGTPCDDGVFCTTGEVCTTGTCGGGKAMDCSSTGCSAGVCNESLKKCDGTPKADGSACDADGSGCTKSDACKSGVCVAGAKVDCAQPQDVCNDWACNPTGAVTYACAPKAKTLGTPCEDGKFCTSGDNCDGKGGCTAGGATDCSVVADSCNDATCDEPGKKCTAKAKADGLACSDGDTCTSGDACKTGACLGATNSCGDFKVSMTLTGSLRAPAIVDLGNGRYRLAWAYSSTDLAARGFRADWSREWTEKPVANLGQPIFAHTALAVGTAHDVMWGANVISGGSCTRNVTYCGSSQYSCTTSNGCGSGCSSYNSVYTAYTGNQSVGWQRFDDLNAASGAITNAYAASNSCSSSTLQPETNFRADVYSDGKRFIVYTLNATNYKKILDKAGALVKDLGTDTAMKNYDVAVYSDGTTVLVWDDGAEIFAQMYSAAGDKSGVQFQVNTKITGVQSAPRVKFEPNGRFVVAWYTDQGAGDVALQVYKSDGSTIGNEIAVNTTVTGQQLNPRLAVFQDGSFLCAYEDTSGKDSAGKGILGQWFTGTGTKVGAEKVLNATVAGDQRGLEAQGLSSDEAVVAWIGADNHVYARKFDKSGTVLNGAKEFLVNTYKTGEQADPAVSVVADGSFVITYSSDGLDGAGAGIGIQRYDADGLPLGKETVVNDYSTAYKTGQQITPAISNDLAGNFAVVWDSVDQDGDIDGIFGQRFKGDGTKNGNSFAINTTTANEQQHPVIAMLTGGKFAVAWDSFGQLGGNNYDVMMRCYDETGAATSAETFGNAQKTSKQQYPALAAFTDGSDRYVLVWQSLDEDAVGGYGIFAQIFYKDCKPIGAPFLVNTFKTGDQKDAKVAIDAAGNFTIVWSSATQDGDNFGIYGQAFDKNAAKVGVEFKLNGITAGEQSRPAVSYLANGTLAAVWQTIGEDEAGYGLKAATYKPGGGAQIGLDWLANTTFLGDQARPVIGGRADGSWVIAWKSNGQDGDKGAIIGRIFK